MLPKFFSQEEIEHLEEQIWFAAPCYDEQEPSSFTFHTFSVKDMYMDVSNEGATLTLIKKPPPRRTRQLSLCGHSTLISFKNTYAREDYREYSGSIPGRNQSSERASCLRRKRDYVAPHQATLWQKAGDQPSYREPGPFGGCNFLRLPLHINSRLFKRT